MFSSTFAPQEQPCSRLGTSQRRARQHVAPLGPKAGRLESTWSGQLQPGPLPAWGPQRSQSQEFLVCLGVRFLSKRECPLELRLPFLPLTPEQMGFMLGSLLHVQNFPPEARGHCVQKGVRCPWEPPQGGLAGERAWLEFKDATLRIKGTSPSGGFRAVCLEEVQTELPAAAAQRDTSSRDEWRSCSTCSPGSSICFQTQEKAAKDSGSLRAALDKPDLHPGVHSAGHTRGCVSHADLLPLREEGTG